MASSDVIEIHPLTEADLEQQVALVNTGFQRILKQFLGFVPPGRGEGDRCAQRFFRPDTHTFVVKDAEGIQATVYLQRSGSRAVPGPLAVGPAYQAPWRPGTARQMVDHLMASARQHGCVLDAVTFPQSPTHLDLYYPYGGPFRQAPFLVRRPSRAAGVAGGTEVIRYSEEDVSQAAVWRRQMDEVTARFWPGYSHAADVCHVVGRSLGDVLLAVREGSVLGYAILHHGPGSEAFADDQLLVKYLCVDPTAPDPRDTFHSLLNAADAIAREAGYANVGVMASTGRRATLLGLLERGFKVAQMHEQWLMAPGRSDADLALVEAGSQRADQYVLAEWR